MVGLLAVGFVANLLMRPVAAKHHVKDGADSTNPYPQELEGAQASTPGASATTTTTAGGQR